jgi:hypothetical protein
MNHHQPEDAEVLQVISRQRLYGKWFVEVHYTSYGKNDTTDLMVSTTEEALNIRPGYKFKK